MERITRFRARILFLVLCLIVGFFAFKVYDLQIISNDGSALDISTFTTMTRVKAARGDILDCKGNKLVGNRASYDLVINHFVLNSCVSPNTQLYNLVTLCDELGIEYNDHFPITETRPFTYTLDQYNSTWQEYFQLYLANQGDLDSDITAPLLMETLRRDYEIPAEWSDEMARKVIGLHYELQLRTITTESNFVFIDDVNSEDLAVILELNVPGMNVETSTVREYYTTAAAHILGYCGKMNETEWEYYEGLGYAMDAEVGKDGFELAFEEQLHGTDGWRVDVVTADGTVIKSYYETEPKAGNNVEVTIDLTLQQIAEDSMAEIVADLIAAGADGADVEGMSTVVMTTTGQVLACASYPTFNPATMIQDWDKIMEADHNPMFNRALNATYPPGSTFKPAMVVAGFLDGFLTKETIIHDKGVFTEYEGFNPMCLIYSGFGYTHQDLDVRRALAVSCNYFFYVIGDEIQLSIMTDVAKAMGLGEPTGVELSEDIGHRSNREEKAKLYGGEDGDWNQGDKVLTAIGQAYNMFSPMQLCVYASTLANQGTRYKATFLNRVVSSDYRELIVENQEQIASQLTIPEDAVEAYSEGMYMVTTNWEGTAEGYFDGCAVEVCGKTGTAEHGRGTEYSDHGAFMCYAPKENPQIAIAVYGEQAGHGNTLATIARRIIDAYFSGDAASDVETYENYPG